MSLWTRRSNDAGSTHRPTALSVSAGRDQWSGDCPDPNVFSFSGSSSGAGEHHHRCAAGLAVRPSCDDGLLGDVGRHALPARRVPLDCGVRPRTRRDDATILVTVLAQPTRRHSRRFNGPVWSSRQSLRAGPASRAPPPDPSLPIRPDKPGQNGLPSSPCSPSTANAGAGADPDERPIQGGSLFNPPDLDTQPTERPVRHGSRSTESGHRRLPVGGWVSDSGGLNRLPPWIGASSGSAPAPALQCLGNTGWTGSPF